MSIRLPKIPRPKGLFKRAFSKDSADQRRSDSVVSNEGPLPEEDTAVSQIPPEPVFSGELPSFTPEEITLLRTSFEIAKRLRQEVGAKIVSSFEEGMPETMEKGKAYQVKTNESWQVLGIGTSVLSGIERSLLRLENPKQFSLMISRLTDKHAVMGIRPNDLGDATIICQSVFLKFMRDTYTEHLQHEDEEFCAFCNVWNRFFDYLKIMLYTSGKAVESASNAADFKSP